MTPAKRIGKYPVVREIGSGTMGKVFEGFDPDTGEMVLLAVHPGVTVDDARAATGCASAARSTAARAAPTGSATGRAATA